METTPEQLKKDVTHLLKDVSSINKRYQEIAAITGEGFNIFSILGVTRNETSTHSAFLAALLNPKGKHGLGDIMLSHFLRVIEVDDLDLITASIRIERSIGKKSKDATEGGRIDIIIEDEKGFGIIIENKIDASDQEKQLLRYSSYGNERYRKGHKLLYLNLYGRLPSDKSIKDENTGKALVVNEHYKVISYEKVITKWLEECKKEATNYPILRETLTQYIYLIKKLTNQSTNKKMEKEIINQILHSEETLEAAFNISQAVKAAQSEIFSVLKSDIVKWAEENNYEVKDKKWGEIKESYIYFSSSKTNYKVPFFFCFDNWFNSFCIGIDKNIETQGDLKLKIAECLTQIFGKTTNPQNYTYLYYFQGDWANWSDRRFMWREIISGKTQEQFIKWIKEVTTELEKVFEANPVKDKH